MVHLKILTSKNFGKPLWDPPSHYPVCDILIPRYPCGTVFNSTMRQTHQQDTPRKGIHFYSIASAIFRVSLLNYLLSAVLGDALQQKSEKSDMTY